MNLTEMMIKERNILDKERKWLQFYPESDHNRLMKEISEREAWKNRKSTEKYQQALTVLSEFRTDCYDFDGDAVKVGGSLDESASKRLENNLQVFKPWRKGPFQVYNHYIDTEWRSEKKWKRIVSHLPDLENKTVLDVGCNNGYYLFKLASFPVKHVLGIDPTIHYYYTYQAIRSMISEELPLDYEILGVEHAGYFKKAFDVVLLMGILYHHASPLDVLKKIKKATRPGGTLIIETQGIQGEGPYALFPRKRYAKAPGSYFIPTKECLENFVLRAGFKNVEFFFEHPMSSQEQRKTKWMNYESYEDFISPENPEMTVEGYPAPWRFYLKCQK